MKSWLFAGCYQDDKPDVYSEKMRRLQGNTIFHGLAGYLCYPLRDGLYVACLSRLPGAGYSAFAFFDQSSPDRSKRASSTIFVPNLQVGPHTICAGLADKFPWLLARLPYLDISRAERFWIEERDRRRDMRIVESTVDDGEAFL